MTVNKHPNWKPNWEEQIIVVKRDWLFAGEMMTFQGVQTDEDAVEVLFQHLEEGMEVMRRGNSQDPTPKENNAEINFDYKQPIPYFIIKRGHELYAYERLTGGGEARLHGKLSLGFGGHMNKTSDSFNQSLLGNIMRELGEELHLELPEGEGYKMRTIGFINDDSEEVSKVHIGLLGIIDLPLDADVKVKEVDQIRGFWVPIARLGEDDSVHERLENWSKIAVDHLYNELPDSERMPY